MFISRNPVGLRILGILKIICAIAFAAAGIGILHLLGPNLEDKLEHLIRVARIDPGNYYINSLLHFLVRIDDAHLKAIGAGTFFYAMLYSVEGVGLILYKRWAEYLTVVATGVFLPLEIYEVIKKITLLKVSILVLNIAIVGYLLYLLRRQIMMDHRHQQHKDMKNGESA